MAGSRGLGARAGAAGWPAVTAGRALFVQEFLRNPLRTASLVSSSPRVARRMAAAVPAGGDPVVVELGPGTGAFTAEIQRRLGGRGRHLAVELNDRFAGVLRRRFPAVEVAVDDATELRRVLDQRGVDRADTVISGLPHALYSDGAQRELMGAVCECLTPDASFVAFAYVHAAWAPRARRFARLLDATFGQVSSGRIVWGNLPPAFVYTACRLRGGGRRPVPSGRKFNSLV